MTCVNWEMVSLPQEFSIRNDTLDDVKTISGHRRPMFADMGYTDEAVLRVGIDNADATQG